MAKVGCNNSFHQFQFMNGTLLGCGHSDDTRPHFDLWSVAASSIQTKTKWQPVHCGKITVIFHLILYKSRWILYFSPKAFVTYKILQQLKFGLCGVLRRVYYLHCCTRLQPVWWRLLLHPNTAAFVNYCYTPTRQPLSTIVTPRQLLLHPNTAAFVNKSTSKIIQLHFQGHTS